MCMKPAMCMKPETPLKLTLLNKVPPSILPPQSCHGSLTRDGPNLTSIARRAHEIKKNSK